VSSLWADVVKGYADAASSLLERWSRHHSTVDGPGVDDPARDHRARASNAKETGFLAALQMLDSVAVLTGRQYEPYIIDSETFSTSLTAATLVVTGPLTNGHASDELPVESVRVEPRRLGPAETEFRLRADAACRRGGTYLGTVLASTSDATESVAVWIVVS
jgi:hypothetical protein